MTLPSMNAAHSLTNSARIPLNLWTRQPAATRPACTRHLASISGKSVQAATAKQPEYLPDFLKVNGWKKGVGPNYYLPEEHPHLHAGLNGAQLDFLAYSNGKNPPYRVSIQIVRDGYYIDNSLAKFDAAVRKAYDDDTANLMYDQARELVDNYAK